MRIVQNSHFLIYLCNFVSNIYKDETSNYGSFNGIFTSIFLSRQQGATPN